MNREQIIAELKKRGIAFDEKATTEALNALLGQAQPQAGRPATAASSSSAPAEEAEELEEEEEASTQAAAQPKRRTKAPRTQPVTTASPNDELTRLQARLDTIDQRYQAERRTRIERAVDDCIADDRVPGAQREKWVTRAMADETVLDDLRAMPARPPGS